MSIYNAGKTLVTHRTGSEGARIVGPDGRAVIGTLTGEADFASGAVADQTFGWVRRYRIKGYQDGSLTPCAACADTAWAAWDGSFFAGGVILCVWYATYPLVESQSIGGKKLSLSTTLRIDADGHAELWVICSPGANTVWIGACEGVCTPVGIYTRSEGCDLTDTLEIVEA